MAQTARWHLKAQHDALQIVAKDAGKVAQKCNPRDALHVPAEGDFFQAHHNHAGRRADDEHGNQ